MNGYWSLRTYDRFIPTDTFTYAGLALTLAEVQALFRFEKMRRAAVKKEMRRMQNIVANRAGKKDPVFERPIKVRGPRKTNPKDVGMNLPDRLE